MTAAFRPRVTQYYNWETSAIRNEIARIENVTPEMLSRMSSADKGKRTTKLRVLRKELASRAA